ncbi:MAG: DUF922 domain-containing protein [Mesorhizobium sp.]|uniref:DUF922 domain-containing Zn-dependent protease n=1 Tax=Mesorhizobium sp. TaxID=1871066 RepID=UPI000FE9AB10|nr:DUF922 domain-containing protein [Mesorhizobium sp.]RWE55947.1 MAG: DUF922 domain-containing protein [Mesorhizobium sp.]RWF10956.1 MAG: DUF922 domain-containing protein [Mesorhizobium sp.]RWF17225.1 MAG: DUF922 domain-containing protein [Mesorhizobium sp.]
MKTVVLKSLLLACLLASPAQAGWKPVEKVETYAVSGQTGPQLHASMGERGPMIGKSKVRAMAYTNFKLTWVRDYQRQGNACVLVSARPKLIITYTLPKTSGPVPAAVQKSWDVFAAGLAAHEKVHGDIIVDMVREIETATIGLSVPDDPGCEKIRTEMTSRLAELSQAQRQASRDFDRVEFAPRGNLQQLIVALLMGR